MIALITSTSLIVSVLSGAPAIDKILPDPLPRGSSAQITGTGFVAGATTVTIDDVTQTVAFADATQVIFTVTGDAPLGPGTLTVTAGGESDTAAVVVVPPAPVIGTVTPDDALVLGQLATVQGEGLVTVASVELDGEDCIITEQAPHVLVFRVPFLPSLIGQATLTLTSPSGSDATSVDVVAPAPQIDAIAPNPAKASTLVTVRGTIVPLAPKVEIGAVTIPLLTAEDDKLVVYLPAAIEAGPHDLVVTAAAIRSDPAGPLFVQAADDLAPVVRAVYPARVAVGQAFWVIGDHLDGVTTALPGLDVPTCDRRSCRIGTSGLEPGLPFTAAVDGPHGASVFQAEIVDEEPDVAVVTRIEPSPAIRGESLAIYADNAVAVRSVIIGGQAQTIDFFDAEKVVVTVHEQTPLGSQTLFVASNVGSQPFAATVLDPLPQADPGPEAEPAVEATPEADASGEDDTSVVEKPKGGDDGCGCAGGPTSSPGVVLALAWLALMSLRARVSRRRGSSR